MPQLPSGRHIAVTASRLPGLAKQYEESGEPAELRNVRHIDDIKAFVDVLYFRETGGSGSFAPGLPPGLEPYPSGHTLATIEDEMGSWSREDQKAFRDYLREEHVSRMLNQALAVARRAQVARMLKTGEAVSQEESLTLLTGWLLYTEEGRKLSRELTDDDLD